MKFKERKIALIISFLVLGFGSLHAQTVDDAIRAIDRMEMDKAKNILNSVLGREPGNAAALYELGVIQVQNDNNDSALNYFQKAVSANANEPLGYVGLGRVLLKQKKNNEAKSNFEKALTLSLLASNSKKQPFVLNQVADAIVDAKDFTDADYALDKALKARELDKKNLDYTLTVGDAYRLKGEGGKGQKEYEAATAEKYPLAYVRLGDFFSKLNDLQGAEDMLKKALGIDSLFPPAWRSLGELYFKKQQLGLALSSYKKFLSLVGSSCDERVRYASFLFLIKNYKDALNELEKAEPNCGNNILMLRLMGYAYYETGDFKKGLPKMEQYFKLMKPENTITQDYSYYGKLLQKNGQDSLAVIKLKQALERDTTQIDLYDDLAKAYSNMKHYEDAAKTIETKMSKTKPNINKADYFVLGQYYYFGGNTVKADSAFAKVNEFFPNYVTGYVYRARNITKADPKMEKGLAKPYYDSVIAKGTPTADKFKSEITEAYSYLYYYYYLKKDEEKATANARKVLELDPANKGAKDLIEYYKKAKEKQKGK